MTRRTHMACWQPHVEEARRRGVSLKACPAEQGLSLYSLYRPRRCCVKRPVEPTASPSGKFAAGRVVAAPALAMLREMAQLPNGISLHRGRVRQDRHPNGLRRLATEAACSC